MIEFLERSVYTEMKVMVAVFLLLICVSSCIVVNHMCKVTLMQILLLPIEFFLFSYFELEFNLLNSLGDNKPL